MIGTLLIMLTLGYLTRGFRVPACRLSACRNSVRSRFLSTSTNNEVHFNERKPSHFNHKFLQAMNDRGYMYQCSDYNGLDEKLMSAGTHSAYLGFDATARSLHIGSLVQIMILRLLQKSGIKPIILVGGGTSKVGDPTGKDATRQLLSEEDINKNIEGITQVFSKYVTIGDGPTDAILVNNADWLDNLKYLEFLRDYGKYFTVNRMLAYESVKQRLAREQPFSFIEFNYMLLQSYDFLELHRKYGTCLQLGGSDQYGNIISGIELARKSNQISLYGLTTPLIATSDGRKMGKSEAGAVWLDKELLSPFEYWQFWRNTADADTIRFLKLFTEVPMDQVRECEKLTGSDLNSVKQLLADEATALLHGPECLAAIHETAATLFSAAGGSLDELPRVQLTPQDFQRDAVYHHGETVKKGLTIPTLVVLSKLLASKAEAKRSIANGGIRVNDEKVTDVKMVINEELFDKEGRLKLSMGKKNHVVVLRPPQMSSGRNQSV